MHATQLWLCGLLLVGGGGSACAMNRPAAGEVQCIVKGGDLLPVGSGGADGLCAEIRQAMSDLTEKPAVTVTVLSPHALSAEVVVSGRSLPPIRFARTDAVLSQSAFQRFARAIADASSASR